MNRDQAKQLIDAYKKFPKTDIFSIKPISYPLFYLLECYAKGWPIIFLHRDGTKTTMNNIPFEDITREYKNNKHNTIWRYCALTPDTPNFTLKFVQEDLFARYVGKLFPLKTSKTTWTCFPSGIVAEDESFFGTLGNSKLYLLQINLDTTNIIGKRNSNLPWHYLQQTIEWKPWTGDIPWQGEQHTNDDEPDILRDPVIGNTLRERFNFIRML